MASVAKERHHDDQHQHETTTTTEGVTMGWMPAWFYDVVVHVFTHGRESKLRREFLNLAEIVTGETVLDVGCGTGTCAIMLADDVGATGKVVGVDPSPNFLKTAQQKAKSHANNYNISFEEGVAESLPAQDCTFDTVVSSFALHHMPGKEFQTKVLKEMLRVLKPGGKLLVVDFPGEQDGNHHHHHHGIHCCGQEDEINIEEDPLHRQIQKVGFEQARVQQVRMMGALAFTARKP